MRRLRFIDQEEVDIRLRTDRGSSPRRLVPWWARALREVSIRWEMCRLRRGSLSIRSSRLRFSGLHSSSRRSVVKALFSRNRMKGAWESHAVSPRVSITSECTKAQLLQVKLAGPTFFWIQCWLSTGVTQPAARTFGEAPQLGRILLGYCESGEQRQRDLDHTLLPDRCSCWTIAIGALLIAAGHWRRSRPPNSIRG